ncbi:hypothetical protein SCUCBS95973_007757 [Sporothrix curviconia]|uniref:Nuclear pore complex protein n=1 Tax=Sporothrix curviconia TaxID=1260050 RepID=A0ABP0CGE3_9PEZI
MTEPSDFTEEERALFDRLNIGKAGGLPLPSFIRPSDVIAQARPMTDAIFDDWTALQKLVPSHETLLLDRWKSLKKRKRRDLLKSAWTEAAAATASATDDKGSPAYPATDMPLPHRPDLVAWRRREREKGQQLKDGSSSNSFAAPENLVTLLDWTADDRAAFLWPHISLDDLAHRNTRALWLLATSRASVPPEAFAATDLDTTRLGKACLALLPRYLNQYSMLFSDRTTPEMYGQLYTWEALEALTAKSGSGGDDDNTPGSDSFAARGTHPGEGLWILTIQARLYRFLVLSVRAVLGSSVDTSNGNGEGAGAEKTSGQRSALEEAAAPYTDGPLRSLETAYRVPPTAIDLQALLDVVYAKVFETEDHVWALRTDPAYFRATLQDWAVHRKERLPEMGKEPTDAAQHAPAVINAAVVDACLRRALEQAETWNLLYTKVSLLAQQMENNAETVAEAAQSAARGQTGKLPRDVLLSFYALYYHIRSFENEPVGLLQTGAFSSPSLKKHYRLEEETAKDGTTKMVVVAAEGTDAPPVVGDESNGHGAWDLAQARAVAIWALTGLQDDATRQLFGRQTLLDELETAVRTLREAGNEVLSPWVTDHVATLALYARCTALLERFQPWAAAYDQTVQHDTEIRDILTMDFHMSMGKLRALLEHSLGVSPPSFVVGSEEETKTTNAAEEKQLAAFWATVYLALEEHKALTPRLKQMLTQSFGDEGKTAEATEKAVHDAARGDRRVVDRRAVRVFRALFHDPAAPPAGGNNTPATLTWPDVIHALKVAGFGAERLYASAWLFVPGQVAKMAAIVAAAKGAPSGRRIGGRAANGKASTTPRPSLFHEPMAGGTGDGGSTKLTPGEAKWIGKRLSKAYGWNVSTFVAE